MFPERDIANEFWYFVRGRAIDWRTIDDRRTRTGSKTLDRIDQERSVMLQGLAVGDLAKDAIQRLFNDLERPHTYPTLQEAIYAYLIDRVALNKPVGDYEMWLRTITLIVADALCDPEWLHVIACDWDPCLFESEGQSYVRRGQREAAGLETDHTMAVSKDWSLLSRDTFDFVVQTYAGKG